MSDYSPVLSPPKAYVFKFTYALEEDIKGEQRMTHVCITALLLAFVHWTVVACHKRLFLVEFLGTPESALWFWGSQSQVEVSLSILHDFSQRRQPLSLAFSGVVNLLVSVPNPRSDSGISLFQSLCLA